MDLKPGRAGGSGTIKFDVTDFEMQKEKTTFTKRSCLSVLIENQDLIRMATMIQNLI